MSLQESHEVQVAIYDLSRGTVQSLSAQFLGPQYQIQAIPHTGVVVYGKEYFFGGGIQCEEPTALRRMMGIAPTQIITVGYTQVSQAQFDSWCRHKMATGEFSMEKYDLLSHNCNTFSQAALTEGLGLSQGVPQWVLDVPRIFLSSPLGQMVRPMLDNMQLGRIDGAQSFSSQASISNSNTDHGTPVTQANPWAHISEPRSTPTAPLAEQSTIPPKTYSILRAHTKPLLANETKTVSMCVQKLVAFASGEEEAEALRQVGEALVKGQSASEAQTALVASFLATCLERGDKITFVLMFLRVAVLHRPNTCQIAVHWLQDSLPKSELLKTPAARAMAWLTVSNVMAKDPTIVSVDTLVDTAVQDVNAEVQTRAEVRQAAAAFLYNTVLTLPASDELSDTQVSIICGMLDSVQLERDETVRLRRLLAAARLLMSDKTRNIAVAQLVKDLCFTEVLQALADTHASSPSGKLAKEVLTILEED